jgi:hypothetical protein
LQGSVANSVSVEAMGLASAVESNTAGAQQVPVTIAVNKTNSMATVRAGDRVNYAIVATPIAGVAYASASIVDSLPDYELYAPGTARVDGKAQEPTVQRHPLTWTLPSLSTRATITKRDRNRAWCSVE